MIVYSNFKVRSPPAEDFLQFVQSLQAHAGVALYFQTRLHLSTSIQFNFRLSWYHSTLLNINNWKVLKQTRMNKQLKWNIFSRAHILSWWRVSCVWNVLKCIHFTTIRKNLLCVAMIFQLGKCVTTSDPAVIVIIMYTTCCNIKEHWMRFRTWYTSMYELRPFSY